MRPSASRARRTPVHAGRARHSRSTPRDSRRPTFTGMAAGIIVSGSPGSGRSWSRPTPRYTAAAMSALPCSALRGHHEVLPRRPRQRPHRPRRPRGRGPCAGRRERRGQEHAREDPLRLLPRRTPARSASTGGPSRSASPADARRLGIGMVFQELVQIPALTRRREHRPVPARSARASSIGGRSRGASRRRPQRYGLRRRSGGAGLAALGRRAAARGDREAAAGRRAGPHPRRADARPRAARGREPVRDLRRAPPRRATPSCSSPTSCREVLAGADRITVLRRGVVAGSMPRAEATEAALVSLMFGDWRRRGRRPGTPRRPAAPGAGSGRSSSSGASARGRRAARPAWPPSTSRPAGRDRRRRRRRRQRAARARRRHPRPRAAARRASKYLDGQDATRWSGPRDPRAAASRSSPRTRSAMAAVRRHDAPREHGARRHAPVRAPRAGSRWTGRASRARSRAVARAARACRCRRSTRRAGALSGGNVQRVILARELAPGPAADRRLLSRRAASTCGAPPPRASCSSRARDAGAGVLLISEDLGRALRAERPPRRALPRARSRARARPASDHRRGGRLSDDGRPGARRARG